MATIGILLLLGAALLWAPVWVQALAIIALLCMAMLLFTEVE